MDSDSRYSGNDWFRWEVEKVRKRKSITLLGPYTRATLMDLMWWLPQNGKLKMLTLQKDGDGNIENVELRQPFDFQDSASLYV